MSSAHNVFSTGTETKRETRDLLNISQRGSPGVNIMNQSTKREPDQGHDDERDRRATNIFLLIGFLVIVGAGIWLVDAMIGRKKIDDCLAQGRRNCSAPIEAPAR